MPHLRKSCVVICDKIESAVIDCNTPYPRTAIQSQFYCWNRRAGQVLTGFSANAVKIEDGVHPADTVITTTSELELLRTTLALDHTLFTVQRHTSRPKGCIRVECFASKGMNSPGLTRITSLVAGALKYRRNPRGLTVTSRDDIRHLIVALSKKLELDLKHERLN